MTSQAYLNLLESCHANEKQVLDKNRLMEFREIRKNCFYLHLKECEFRFNYRHENLYEILLKLVKEKYFN
jgi:transposase-like protein